MVHALGYSNNEFNPAKPGRLCRGRERWIEPWKSEEEGPIHRLVVSGAAFTDDSARDALRGINHAGLDPAAVVTTMFPRKEFLAFMEDGHPADIPRDAENVELYETYRAGGRTEVTAVRWTMRVSGVRALREILGEPTEDRVRGFAVLAKDTDVDELVEQLFLLVGTSTLDSPPARFQPLALPELLKLVPAVVLVHRDKHGVALGAYSRDAVAAQDRLATISTKKGALLIPFAIPPMLARWDRALSEAKESWEEAHGQPFPVPESNEPNTWDRRRRGRRRRRDEEPAAETEESAPADPSSESKDEPDNDAAQIPAVANEDTLVVEEDATTTTDDSLLADEDDLLVEEDDLLVEEDDLLIEEEAPAADNQANSDED